MNLQPTRSGDFIEIDGNELNYVEASELCLNLVRCLTQDSPVPEYKETYYKNILTNETKTHEQWFAIYSNGTREMPWVEWSQILTKEDK